MVDNLERWTEVSLAWCAMKTEQAGVSFPWDTPHDSDDNDQ